ncbi:TetR/AcrR family transcriptional regulator [Dactylosporangium sp. CA-233914]|uniref:TetR/AcrR family transcriptional regulator n=1 Tax=Dactylosporangium sp. CA-233914 TaxID=3239934 RepID=UPI003D8C1481
MDSRGEQQATARVVRGRNRIRTGEAEGADVRAHIQRVALDMFIEDGYDKTSLREIAERLGVTKAALYYHFPTKDDIVSSLIEQRIKAVDALLEWAETQPRDPGQRIRFIERYANLHDEFVHENVIRFFERNQTLINTLPAGKRLREQMMRVFELLADPQDTMAQHLRRSMALFAVHASWVLLREHPGTALQRREAALEVATELMSSADRLGAGTPPTDPEPADTVSEALSDKDGGLRPNATDSDGSAAQPR